MSTRTDPAMDSSWLIQRLQKPHSWEIGGRQVDNPFAFGARGPSGGLSTEAMTLLRPIFSFDYMGAAEFEFGAVPKALAGIFDQAADYHAFAFSWPLAEVQKSWRDKSTAVPDGDATVYVICHKTWDDEVKARIRGWASSSNDRHFRLMELTMLAGALRPHDEWDSGRCGWLELDNGVFFFTDREMWEATAGLFGIDTVKT